MSIMATEHNHSSPLQVTQDLSEILRLHNQLLTQAVRWSSHHLMPGGQAMAELAPVGNLESWEHQHATDERQGTHYTMPDLEDDEKAWTAYQTVKFWAEEWRRARDAEYDNQVPTIATEVNFLRWSLEWAVDHEPRWQAFADNIQAARRRLENILTDGHRDIVSDDVTCLLCQRPLRRRMTEVDGYEDEWWCKDCRVHLTPAQFNLAASEAARRSMGLVDDDNEVS